MNFLYTLFNQNLAYLILIYQTKRFVIPCLIKIAEMKNIYLNQLTRTILQFLNVNHVLKGARIVFGILSIKYKFATCVKIQISIWITQLVYANLI